MLNARGLLYRYILALSLIALFVTTAYGVSKFARMKGAENAKIINISGRQRMLSQRITYYAYLYSLAADANNIKKDIYAERLTESLELFEKSHFALINGDDALGLSRLAGIIARDVYFTAPHNVNQNTLNFIRAAYQVIEGTASEYRSEQLDIMMALADRDLLIGLDTVVQTIENFDGRQRSQLEKTETVFYALAILLLLLEARFIFWPSYRSIHDALKEKRILEKTQRALEAANYELEEFAYRTSHDLKSPLISAASLLDLVDQYIQNNRVEEARTIVGKSKTELKRLGLLVEDILTLIRTQFKAQDSKDINMAELVDDILNKSAYLNPDNNIQIITKFTHKNRLHTRYDRLYIILENLISNALKYADRTKDNAFVQVNTHDDDRALTIEVIDNGLGIPDDQENKLFLMFQRLHSSTKFNGTGLGLYMAKKCAELINADLEYESVDKNTIFRLIIRHPRQNDKL
ncbi:MAG: ATP-binding protein [Pseudomonadota bacterium]|nr:ATP-binding protein [Pseudomonadota bacterium]MEE3323375.1 ATP-binding protein [Pseudomonadota bacterium]